MYVAVVAVEPGEPICQGVGPGAPLGEGAVQGVLQLLGGECLVYRVIELFGMDGAFKGCLDRDISHETSSFTALVQYDFECSLEPLWATWAKVLPFSPYEMSEFTLF